MRRRTTSVLKSEATLVHLVLLDDSSRHEVNGASWVNFLVQCSRLECPLLSNKDVEVVIRSVQARVTFRAKRCTEDNEVFGNAGVDDVHGAHGSPSVVEHPLLLVRVDCYLSGGICRGEVRDNVVNHSTKVVGVGSNGCL